MQWKALLGSFAVIALCALAGAGLGFVYLNTNKLEVQAKLADGYPLSSAWDLPWTLPGAILGGTVGAILVVIWSRGPFRSRD